MLPCLRRVLRPALALRPLVPVSNLGTHARNEPVDPLSSPQGARDFIFGLHPAERSCLLRELHRFESIAIAQGEYTHTLSHSLLCECSGLSPAPLTRLRPGTGAVRCGVYLPSRVICIFFVVVINPVLTLQYSRTCL